MLARFYLMNNQTGGIIIALLATAGAVLLGFAVIKSPDSWVAVLANVAVLLGCLWYVSSEKTDRDFLVRMFIGALCVRYLLAFIIYYTGSEEFFGADAGTYDAFGNELCRTWQGLADADSPWVQRITSYKRSGWGMYYFVAGVYYVVGRNPFAAQLLCATLGAVSCVAMYKMCLLVETGRRTARITSLIIAFSPSMVLWSSQLLKDPLIVLALCFCAVYALKLQDRVNASNLALLFLSMFCLYSLRHYAAYIMFIAIAGSMIIRPKQADPIRVLQGSLLVFVLGFAFVYYFGAADVVQSELDLQRIQAGRVWSAKTATSGFGGDVDITDARAAITFLPVGLIYVLFAPFPWMMTNLRQLITLPEMIFWWALAPVMFKGFYFAVKKHFRKYATICLFTVGLLVAYALYQSNVGTAYRHRAQIYVFFVIFIGLGLELRHEAKLKKRAEREFRVPDFSPAPSPVISTLTHRPLKKES
jgi:hypothetical protein